MKTERLRSPTILFLAGLALYLAWKLTLLSLHHDVRWDEAVYLTMGKHLLSGGAVGYWEILRPPLWPALLGVYWTIGSAVTLGELTSVLLGAIGAGVLYQTLRGRVDRWVAALTALLLLFTDIWFWYSSQLLTGIPSATLIIISLALYTKERHGWAGVAAAGAFLTRFPAGLGLAALLAAHATTLWPHRARLFEQRERLQPLLRTLLGFLAPVTLWLAINTVAFRHLGWRSTLAPLLQGSTTAIFENAWLTAQDPLFYLAGLLAAAPITVLALVGAARAHKAPALLPFAYLALFTTLFFSLIPNQQWRFALLILPGVFVLTALGADWLIRWRNALRIPLIALLLVSLAVMAVHDHGFISHWGPEPAPIEEHHWYFAEHPVEGTILVSEPMLAWYAPNPARPIYYEYFRQPPPDWEREYAAIAITPTQIPCPPQNHTCLAERSAVMNDILERYNLVAVTRHGEEKHYIFSNQLGEGMDKSEAREELTSS